MLWKLFKSLHTIWNLELFEPSSVCTLLFPHASARLLLFPHVSACFRNGPLKQRTCFAKNMKISVRLWGYPRQILDNLLAKPHCNVSWSIPKRVMGARHASQRASSFCGSGKAIIAFCRILQHVPSSKRKKAEYWPTTTCVTRCDEGRVCVHWIEESSPWY